MEMDISATFPSLLSKSLSYFCVYVLYRSSDAESSNNIKNSELLVQFIF